jgi:hypothetical protein
MFPVIDVGTLTKWGIDFTTSHSTSSRGNHYIIVVIEYFSKWVEAMRKFSNDGQMDALFILNQIVSRFSIPKDIFTDHKNHFQNKMMTKLTSKLGFKK